MQNYLELFLQQYDSLCTRKSYEDTVNKMLTYIGKDISDIKRIDCVDWKNSLKHFASASQAQKIIAVKSYFKFLYDNEILNDNPAEKLSCPKIQNKIKDAITYDEAKELMKYGNPRERAIISVFISTGVRVTELINIQLKDYLNNSTELILVTKGNKYRKVFLNQDCQNYINEYLKVRKNNCSNLFTSNGGRPLTESNLNCSLKKLAKKAGIEKNITNHSLRATFVTKIAMEYNPEVARIAVGHSNIATTQRYIRGVEDTVKNVMLDLKI